MLSALTTIKKVNKIHLKKKPILSLASVAQLVGALSCKPKGCGFNSQSGHVQEATDQ